MSWRAASVLGASLALGCTVGQGEGAVYSDNLVVPECWSGEFDLEPDFFAALPYRDTQVHRIQRGSDLQEVSDGVAVLVSDVQHIRDYLPGQPLPIGLPPGLARALGLDEPDEPAPRVNLAFYLQFSCHNQNVVLYATSGSIVFSDLFSGDPHESVGADKLIDATFEAQVADPRDAAGTGSIPAEKTSQISGWYRFFYERGQPGQPFP